ncbi:MAG: hypothetical protein IGS03_13960 [Candidatus Sericytochromatia bacterium]|nr:hypothetical protein [Candidatus Sericytochromatia bacterium]
MKKSPFLRQALLISFFLFGLQACAARPDARPENWASVTALNQSASQFIQSLFQQDIEAVIKHSELPFYFNHQAILSTEAEWRDTLRQLRLATQPTEVRILALEPYVPARLEREKTELWLRLLKNQFDTQAYLMARLQVLPGNGRPAFQEEVLLLLDPVSTRVVGFAY